MTKISIGTAGWDYKDWIGSFYPNNLNRKRELEFYSKYFDVIEVNSTFYNLPSKEMVRNWNNRVPENFRFIIKVWKEITHKLDEQDINLTLNQFLESLEPLGDKIVGLLFQFPPWFKFSEAHLTKLVVMFRGIPLKYKILIELRDNSWFDPEILSNIIDGKNRILVTTYKPKLDPYYLPNQDFYYIRLIGDRELSVFNRVQREQSQALRDLFQNLDNLKDSPGIYEIFIIVNNHFQGHGPSSANFIKQQFGLPFKAFNNQKSLIEYFK